MQICIELHCHCSDLRFKGQRALHISLHGQCKQTRAAGSVSQCRMEGQQMALHHGLALDSALAGAVPVQVITRPPHHCARMNPPNRLPPSLGGLDVKGLGRPHVQSARHGLERSVGGGFRLGHGG